MHVLTDLKQRGVADILICCVDGLTGFPEAIEKYEAADVPGAVSDLGGIAHARFAHQHRAAIAPVVAQDMAMARETSHQPVQLQASR
jgi:hypothetical protein